MLLEHIFTCHAYSEVLGRCRGVGKRSSELVVDPDANVAMESVQGEVIELQELDEGEESVYDEIEDSDDDDIWSEGGALESDMEDVTDLWAGFDSPDEKAKDEEEEEVESWSDIGLEDD